MKYNNINKKGSTFSLWIEVIMFSMLIVIMFTFIVGDMNQLYNQNNQVGLVTNDTMDKFEALQGGTGNEIRGGSAEFTTAQGLNLLSSWAIIKAIWSAIVDFIMGTWISTILTGWIGLPSVVAIIFQILYWFSLLAIVIWILFKVRP